MNRRTARRKNARSESWRASQVLRDARSKRRRARDIGAKKYGDVRRHASDDARLERGAAVLDDLYEAFRGRG